METGLEERLEKLEAASAKGREFVARIDTLEKKTKSLKRWVIILTGISVVSLVLAVLVPMIMSTHNVTDEVGTAEGAATASYTEPQEQAQEEPRTEVRNDKVSGPIGLELTHKNFWVAAGGEPAQHAFVFNLTNHLDRDVKAFTGQLIIVNYFDQVLLSEDITYEDLIKAGETIEWSATKVFNRFVAGEAELKERPLKELTARLIVKQVMYPDGKRDWF